MKYTEKLSNAIHRTQSVLCIGLDPVPERLPEQLQASSMTDSEKVLEFCKTIIQETRTFAAAYKPNLGFFEALGAAGIAVFEELGSLFPDDVITIADAKRGDIGNTAHRYKHAFFDIWNYDAITLSPLMGFDTIAPFLTDESKGVYVLTLTSNPGAEDILQQQLASGITVSALIAQKSGELNNRFPAHTGMVVGATQAVRLPELLKLNSRGSLLIPGVGSQGGDVSGLMDGLAGHQGLPLVNVSRSIIYATEPHNETNYAADIRTRAALYHAELKPLAKRYLNR